MSQQMPQYFLIICTSTECINKILSEVIDIYKTKLYHYNTMIKKSGVYLKPMHIVVKKDRDKVRVYYYYGKYWYRISYNRGKLKWIYIGNSKPLLNLPDPPLNPLTLIKIMNNDGKEPCIYADNVYSLEKLYYYIAEAMRRIGCIDIENLEINEKHNR